MQSNSILATDNGERNGRYDGRVGFAKETSEAWTVVDIGPRILVLRTPYGGPGARKRVDTGHPCAALQSFPDFVVRGQSINADPCWGPFIWRLLPVTVVQRADSGEGTAVLWPFVRNLGSTTTSLPPKSDEAVTVVLTFGPPLVILGAPFGFSCCRCPPPASKKKAAPSNLTPSAPHHMQSVFWQGVTG